MLQKWSEGCNAWLRKAKQDSDIDKQDAAVGIDPQSHTRSKSCDFHNISSDSYAQVSQGWHKKPGTLTTLLEKQDFDIDGQNVVTNLPRAAVLVLGDGSCIPISSPVSANASSGSKNSMVTPEPTYSLVSTINTDDVALSGVASEE